MEILQIKGNKWEMYIPSDLGYGDGGSGAQIKGGDVLVFQMEILQIKGNKVRATICDLKTRDGCEKDEILILDTWAKKDIAIVKAELTKVKAKLDGTMKKGEREPYIDLKKMLARIVKSKKKGEEL